MSQITSHTHHPPSPSLTTGHRLGQSPDDIHTHLRTVEHASITQTNKGRAGATLRKPTGYTPARTHAPHTSHFIKATTPSMATTHFHTTVTLSHHQTHPSPHPAIQISYSTSTEKATNDNHSQPPWAYFHTSYYQARKPSLSAHTLSTPAPPPLLQTHQTSKTIQTLHYPLQISSTFPPTLSHIPPLAIPAESDCHDRPANALLEGQDSNHLQHQPGHHRPVTQQNTILPDTLHEPLQRRGQNHHTQYHHHSPLQRTPATAFSLCSIPPQTRPLPTSQHHHLSPQSLTTLFHMPHHIFHHQHHHFHCHLHLHKHNHQVVHQKHHRYRHHREPHP